MNIRKAAAITSDAVRSCVRAFEMHGDHLHVRADMGRLLVELMRCQMAGEFGKEGHRIGK